MRDFEAAWICPLGVRELKVREFMSARKLVRANLNKLKVDRWNNDAVKDFPGDTWLSIPPTPPPFDSARVMKRSNRKGECKIN